MNTLIIIFSILGVLHARVRLIEIATKAKEEGKGASIATESLLMVLSILVLIKLVLYYIN